MAATGARGPGRTSNGGNTVLVVVVRHPEKNAGTSTESRRSTVVQSRQPIGPNSPQVVDRLVGQQVALVAVEGHEDRQEVPVRWKP